MICSILVRQRYPFFGKNCINLDIKPPPVVIMALLVVLIMFYASQYSFEIQK